MDEICYYIMGHFTSLEKMSITEKTIDNILNECRGELLSLIQDRKLIFKHLFELDKNKISFENEISYCRGYVDTFSTIYQNNGIWKIQIPNYNETLFNHFNNLNGKKFFMKFFFETFLS